MCIDFDPLPRGDVGLAAPGAHVVLEAPGGALLHAVVVRDGLVAFRSGLLRQLRIARTLPAATIVRYPSPFGPSTEEEMAQAVARASSLVGIDSAELVVRLGLAGADESALASGDEALIAESFASFCVTGTARCWHVSDAYRAVDRAKETAGLGKPSGPVTEVLSSQCGSDMVSLRQSMAVEPPRGGEVGDATPATVSGLRGSTETSTGMSTLQEKAVSTVVHAGLRGPAARAAGAAAAIGCEGYGLYKEISAHGERLQSRDISACQYQEKVYESTVTSSGRAIGGLAGAAAGQAAIPVPLVGAVVGGLVGAACGGAHAASFARGMWRMSGGSAHGGDDLVRCVEHRAGEERTCTTQDSDTAVVAASPGAGAECCRGSSDPGDSRRGQFRCEAENESWHPDVFTNATCVGAGDDMLL